MSMTILQMSASFLIRTVGPGTFYWFFLVLLAAGSLMLLAIGRVIVGRWIERTHCRDWPIVPAIVDIVSVAYREPEGSPIMHFKATSYNAYYQATLTYIYHYPEEQMGDYSRSFGKKEDADAWASSYKGGTVKVHVDPSDPTRSVLREEDL